MEKSNIFSPVKATCSEEPTKAPKHLPINNLLIVGDLTEPHVHKFISALDNKDICDVTTSCTYLPENLFNNVPNVEYDFNLYSDSSLLLNKFDTAKAFDSVIVYLDSVYTKTYTELEVIANNLEALSEAGLIENNALILVVGDDHNLYGSLDSPYRGKERVASCINLAIKLRETMGRYAVVKSLSYQKPLEVDSLLTTNIHQLLEAPSSTLDYVLIDSRLRSIPKINLNWELIYTPIMFKASNPKPNKDSSGTGNIVLVMGTVSKAMKNAVNSLLYQGDEILFVTDSTNSFKHLHLECHYPDRLKQIALNPYGGLEDLTKNLGIDKSKISGVFHFLDEASLVPESDMLGMAETLDNLADQLNTEQEFNILNIYSTNRQAYLASLYTADK